MLIGYKKTFLTNYTLILTLVHTFSTALRDILWPGF